MTPEQLRHSPIALKEWSIAIEALLAGEMTLLLRKGGIRDRAGNLDRLLQLDRALLFPTVEHQQAALLKPDYADRLPPVPPAPPPETITLRGWARWEQVFAVRSLKQALALSPFLIWNDHFIRDRWHWKPERPLYVLLLRAYRLRPHTIPFKSEYQGCRSLVELTPAIALDNQQPALSDATFEAIKINAQQILNSD